VSMANLNRSVLTGVMPGLVYGTHAGTVADMTACMSHMSVYQQQQQQFGVYIDALVICLLYMKI